MKWRTRGALLFIVFGFLIGCDNTEINDDSGADSDGTSDETIENAFTLGTGVESNFENGEIDIEIASLSAGGRTSLSLSVVDSTTHKLRAGVETQIRFSSQCIDLNKAAVSNNPVSTFSGRVTVTYEDLGCGAVTSTDTITASVGSAVDLASGNIDIAPPQEGAIEFTSAEPETIALKGVASSNLPEQAMVRFRVVDTNGNPLVGKTVNFDISTNIGGITLTTVQAITDEEGDAQTFLNSGSVNTTVRVIASIVTEAGMTISTSSSPIAINTGLPDQDSFSISTELLNPAAWDFDGTEVGITIRAADHFNNPVPDGTNIAFTTEGGSIDGSCQTDGGVCTATWMSQDPRPVGGVVTILARSTGTSSFIDENSNGQFDSGEIFTPLGEAYLDENLGEGISGYELGEFFSDFNFNGIRDEAPKFYQGVLCSDIARSEGHCDEQVEVRAAIPIIMSSRALGTIEFRDAFGAVIDLDIPFDFILGEPLTLFIADVNGNIPPVGTEIEFDTDNGTTSEGGVVPNTFSTNGYSIDIQTSPDNAPSIGTLTATVTTPGGVPTSISLSVSDEGKAR